MPDCVLGLHPNKAEELVGFDLVLWLGFVSFFFLYQFCTQKKGRGAQAVPQALSSLNFLGTHLVSDFS